MKNEIRLHDGELNVMELLWSNKELAARDISKIIKEYIGWEKNTTYTVIKRLIDKGAIVREDPGFICKANVTKKKIQETETNILLDKFYGGSLVNFINSYMMNYRMNEEERAALLQLAQRKQS
ncbi:BlaI/MecI/CopY family transcriptional regulator [Jutongia hominis]|nr:BlaI/MecI/CopY family transcriptional regulator [Jutongia hominis]